MRIRGGKELLLVVVTLKATIPRNLSLQTNRWLRADLEWCPFEIALPNPPVEHLPKQSKVVVDRDG